MNIKAFIEKIKNNLALIILIPTILGGLWQIVELSKMSVSFIRFFSVTQLLPDGLLMLFILISLYIVYYFGSLNKYKINFDKKIMIIHKKKPDLFLHYYIKTNISNKLIYSKNPVFDKNIIWFHIAIILIGTAFLWFALSYYLFNTSKDLDFLSVAMAIIFIMVFGKMILESVIVLCIHIKESKIWTITYKYLSNKPAVKDLVLIPIKFLNIVLFISITFIPIYLFSLFHENYFLPKNLKNLENIQRFLDVKDYNQSQILYLNDKYIFVEHSDEAKNKTIEILLFNELFDK